MRKMNAIDFAERFVESERFDSYVQESFHTRGFDSDRALGMMLDYAEEKGINIVNLGLFDSEEFFWEVQETMEQGLS